MTWLARALVFGAVVAVSGCSGGRAQSAARWVVSDSLFTALATELSEPGGYFDTDNLISNERSYLHVIGDLERRDVTGGVYLGVGPDQNFSYIAAIRPHVAFIIDIRRDNLLQQLIFKALFELAETRVEYLALLLGRRPAAVGEDDHSIDQLATLFAAATVDELHAARARASVDSAIATFGIPLSDQDWATIDRFHRAFIAAGLGLQFQSHGRSPQFYYPTYRDLLVERDRDGQQRNYLASREAFQSVRQLQQRNLVIPVVGDLAGPRALRAIGRVVERQGDRVSAFYTSNVEFYLFRARSFDEFVANVEHLPAGHAAVIIRSVFLSGFRASHPDAVPGYYSVQLLQPLRELSQGHRRGAYPTYWQLVN